MKFKFKVSKTLQCDAHELKLYHLDYNIKLTVTHQF